MINFSTITEQIRQWLADDSELSEFTIVRSEVINTDPGRAVRGWIGVYQVSIDYNPRNLGVAPNNYDGSMTFDLLIQRTNLSSGAEAEDELGATVKTVLDRLVQIPKTYIDHFSDIAVGYSYVKANEKTLYFQAALVTVTAEFSITVN